MGSPMNLDGYQVLPGLINAHDHLDFNLFPRLGRGPYPNATAWAEDIYHPEESPVREHLRLPKHTRLMWGGLKNLLSGVTTVCHHNPDHPVLHDPDFPVRVVSNFGWAHSLRFSADIKERFEATPRDWPFVIHACEGTDAEARSDVFRLHEMGALDSRTVLVHGVALEDAGLELVRKAGAAVVWCPSSNLYVLGHTLSPAVLNSGVPIALGSDSALTAGGDILDEICLARRIWDVDIRPLVTTNPAAILRLSREQDLIAVRDFGQPPEFVKIRGRIRLISPALAGQLPSRVGFHRIQLDGRPPVLVDVDIPKLYEETSAILGPEIFLGGRRVLF
jgi:cytosine/adenosine deaminase-related metal-dependent hydrolase